MCVPAEMDTVFKTALFVEQKSKTTEIPRTAKLTNGEMVLQRNTMQQ